VDTLGNRDAKSAHKCSGFGGGYTEPEDLLLLRAVHACADLATSQLWSHWTTGQGSELAKAADACGTLGNVKGSYTELPEEGTLREKGGKLTFISVM